MKIVLFITGLGIGGAERVVVNLANRLVKMPGQSIQLIFLTGENRQAINIDPAIKVIAINMKRGPLGFFAGLFRIVLLLRSIRPDIAHSHMFHANIAIRISRLFTKIPFLISTEHNKNIGGYYRMLAYRLTDWLSDLNTNVSREATDYFVHTKAFDKRKSLTVYNGIELSKFKPSSDNISTVRSRLGIAESCFVILNVGRLTKAKDQSLLIKAFSIFHSKYSHSRLIVVGEGEEEGRLRDLIHAEELSDAAFLVGSTQCVEEYYHGSDCFVLSSAWEGFGLVIAEAMAAGLPVIATDAGGCSEVLDNPEYLVEVGNSIQLAELMEKVILLAPDQHHELVNRNKESVKRFDNNTIIKSWLRIYKNEG